MAELYRISFYVPEDHLEEVKRAVFEAGAGKIGNYDRCCWQREGQGQFRPLSGSTPFTGTENRTEKVKEFKVELVCSGENIPAAVEALIDSHPYETPAYEYYPINQDLP